MRLYVCLERLFISVLRRMNAMKKLIAWHEFYKLSLSI